MNLCLKSCAIFVCTISSQTYAQDPPGCVPDKNGKFSSYHYNPDPTKSAMTSIIGNRIECVNNDSSGYPCSNVHLESFISLSDLSNSRAKSANDIWGWTSPTTGIEYAIIGLDIGTAFVKMEDCENPVVLGLLPTGSDPSMWRDIKVYQDHAFIVSEATSHGMQVFDLTELESVTEYTDFSQTVRYDGVGSSHNIVINEDSGFAYIVGAGSFDFGPNDCSGGLHMVDISDPVNPTFVGCYSDMGYTHDAQCVNYDGPDSDYTGREICFASNENKVDIIDVTDKANPTYISSCSYLGARYVHQGWLTEDKNYFLIDDELDNLGNPNFLKSNTRTMICDVSNLDRPHMKRFNRSSTTAVDHNQYVKGKYSYQSNYRAGLRILDLSCIQFGGNSMKEVAYFDIYPEDDDNEFNANWSNYPYFESGCVALSGIEQGLFIVKPDIPEESKKSLLKEFIRNSLI